MFGLLDLGSCTIPRSQKNYYSCQVCNALASNFGRASRTLLTNDSVYLSLLIGAQREQLPYICSLPKRKCHPWSNTALDVSDFTYPAAVAMVVRGVRMLDDTHDKQSLQSKTIYAIYRSQISEAEKRLRTFGVQIPSIGSLLEEQHGRERELDKGLEYYSQITEDIYARVFAQTAIIASAPGNYAPLEVVGSKLGRVAYLLDSYQDLQSDRRTGSFNLLNSISSNQLALGRASEFAHSLDESLRSVAQNISRVKFLRYGETLRYMVTDGLEARVRNLLFGIRYAPKPCLYSVAPIVIMTVLKHALTSSSSDEDCCDCCSDDCSGGTGTVHTTTTTTQALLSPAFTDKLVGGATGGLIGGGGGILVNEIASRLRPSTPPPQQPTPDNMDQMEQELDREAEQELNPETEEPPSTDLPPAQEPPTTSPERPSTRQDWLRDRDMGRRPSTELPPGVPKVDIHPPEDPKDGVKIASGIGIPGVDLPLDPNVAGRKLLENVQKGWEKVSDVSGQLWDALRGTEGEQPQPQKSESKEKEESEIGPDARKVLDGMKDSFKLPERMTDAQKEAYYKSMSDGGRNAVEHPAFGTKSEVSKGALDHPVEYTETLHRTGVGQYTDVKDLMQKVQTERNEATATEALRSVRDAVAGRSVAFPSAESTTADAISQHGVKFGGQKLPDAANFSRLSGIPEHHMSADTPDARTLIDMHGNPYQPSDEAHEAWNSFKAAHGRDPNPADHNDQRDYADLVNEIAKRKGKPPLIDDYSIPR